MHHGLAWLHAAEPGALPPLLHRTHYGNDEGVPLSPGRSQGILTVTACGQIRYTYVRNTSHLLPAVLIQG